MNGRPAGSFDELEDEATFNSEIQRRDQEDQEHADNHSFLEHAAEFGKSAPEEFTMACPGCKGSGKFFSYAGRDVGECFKCKGTGRVTKNQLARQAGAKKAKVTRAQNEKSRRERWAEEHPEAYKWMAENDGSNDFATSLYEALIRFGSLTPNQLAAVERSIEREAAFRAQRTQPGVRVEGALDLTPIPEGYYADPEDASRLKLRIDHPTSGKWADWIFVKDAAVYGEGKKYGTQRPGGTYVGEVTEALKKILADPKAASAAYGRLVGRCGVCGRPLEDPESVERGIGPICAGKFE